MSGSFVPWLELARLERAQWLAPERLRGLRWRRLEQALCHAFEQSPFYRKRFEGVGFDPAALGDERDLARLPITRREDLRDPEALLASSYRGRRLRSSFTSGSTGRPTESFFDRRAWLLGKYLLKVRARRACGVRVSDRIALLQEGPPRPPSASERLLRLRRFSLESPTDTLLAELERFRPSVVYGFPSHLSRLARAAQGALRVERIFTSGEMLDPPTREAIEGGLRGRVYDVYGCTELKEIAWECPERQGHHLNADWLWVEVAPAADSTRSAGRLLVTSLYHAAMPLIRYEVGDTGVLLDAGCACGRSLPLLIPNLGRLVDYFLLPDGTEVAPYSLTCAIEKLRGFRQYRIVQEAPDRVCVQIVPEADFCEADARAIALALAPLLPRVAIAVQRLERMPTGPGGKYRVVESRVRGPRGTGTDGGGE